MHTTQNPSKPCSKPCNKALHQTRPPCAPWGAYALTHLDKLWGVNIIKVSALCGKLPIDIIKGFPRNITKHTRRRRPRFSTNPCGKPSFSLPPWGGLWGWIQSKAFAFGRKVTAFSPASPVTLASAQARANKCRCIKQRVGGVCCRHLRTPGGTPKAGTCSSERRAGIVFYWWPIHTTKPCPKNFTKACWGKTFDGTAPTII